MNDFFEELTESEISVRDRQQFELKMDYTPNPDYKKNHLSFDLYFFIPGALQINRNSYPKEQFFQNLTTLIRFKTPTLSFQELLDLSNVKSPLTRIRRLLKEDRDGMENEILQEFKLLANIVRSRLRDEIKQYVKSLQREYVVQAGEVDCTIISLCEQLRLIRKRLQEDYALFLKRFPEEVCTTYWSYVDEFLTMTVVDLLLGCLYELRNLRPGDDSLSACDRVICDFVQELKDDGKKMGYGTLAEVGEEEATKGGELFVYRKGLLRKFVLDVLLLSTERKESAEQYSHINHIVAAFAAGVAMLVYLLIFVWRTDSLIINSTPFILGTVFLYILKDRLKEEIRSVSTNIFKRLPDYTTAVKSPDEKLKMGKLSESFGFLDEKELPPEILEVRNRELHQELAEAKRIEVVCRYSKRVSLNKQFFDKAGRDYALNDIFRFNIAAFLQKASDPYVEQLFLEESTGMLKLLQLHKVYHINVIIQYQYHDGQSQPETSIKKFRLILDKKGIVRMEFL